MSIKVKSKKCGIAIASLGIGLILAIIIPLWGWILFAGVALIYCGWYIIDHHH